MLVEEMAYETQYQQQEDQRTQTVDIRDEAGGSQRQDMNSRAQIFTQVSKQRIKHQSNANIMSTLSTKGRT